MLMYMYGSSPCVETYTIDQYEMSRSYRLTQSVSAIFLGVYITCLDKFINKYLKLF